MSHLQALRQLQRVMWAVTNVNIQKYAQLLYGFMIYRVCYVLAGLKATAARRFLISTFIRVERTGYFDIQ
jgi:hypothetical protein